MSEADVRRDLETRRIADWSTPLTQASHDHQTSLGYGLARKLGVIDRAEPTRTLPDGSIMPNPELGGDRAEFDKAIDGSLGTKEAKEKARGLWDKYHDNYLTNVRPSLETMPKIPGVENYIAWRERMQKEGAFNHLTENQKAEKYMEEQKGRSGFVKFIDNVGSNLLAGSHDLVAGIAGTAGLLTGSKAASEFAAEKAGQAERTTAALQHTGNDGLVNSLVGGGVRALPAMAAAAATGGALGTASKAVGLLGNGARVTQVANALNSAANSAKVARVVNAATAFTQTAGTTYADLYKHHRELGLSHEAASQKATGASMVSGAVSAALGGISLGGAQALSNPATREVVKKNFGEAMKTFLKGSGKEMTQEALDSGVNTIASEMNKGKTLKEATATAFEQLPETLTTAGAMGGGVETAAHLIQGTQWDHHDGAAAPPAPAPGGQGEAGGQPQAASAGSQQGIPQTAMTSETGTAPPAKIPVPTLDEANAAKQTAEKLKAQKGPLSPEQQQAQDVAEKTYARKVEDNILKQQAGIEKRGGKLHPTAAKALADAQEVLARRAPEGTTDAAVEGGTGTSGQQPPTTVNHAPSEAALQRTDGKPSPTSSSPVPTLDEATAAHGTIEQLKSQDRPLSADQRQELDAAEKTYARKVEDNILKQQAGIERRGGKLHPTAAKALADARAVLARPGPGGGLDGSANADNTISYHSNGTDANTTEGTMPGQTVNGQQADSAAAGQPSPTTANKGQPPQTSPLPPPRTPPLSVEQSRRLIENVSKMRPEMQQHPQVQADLAQAQRVVGDHVQKLENESRTPNELRHRISEDLSRADSFGTASKADRAADDGKADAYGADSGTTAFSQGSPFPGPINSKTYTERQVENVHLLTTRPRRRSPFSNNVRVVVQGSHGQVLRKAAILIDHAHDDGDTTELKMGDKVTKANTLGNYQDGTANIRPDGPHPLMTSFHETGHHVAMTMLDDAALERVRDAARDTSRWSELYKLKEQDPDFDLNYYTDPHEVFARAYAQTIAMRTKDLEALTELRWVLKDQRVYFKQWPATQFTRLQKAVEAELHKIGWL